MSFDSEHLATISAYYDGCSTGDVEAMMRTLHPDVVHYFLAPNPGSEAVRGGEHLARYWRKVTRMVQATWVVDHLLDGDHEAVIEWTMTWYPVGHEEPVATRGAEWFTFEDGLIREIRSYYQQREQSTELADFPYLERKYSTLDRAESRLHRATGAGSQR